MYTYHKTLAEGVSSWECVKRRGSKTSPGDCKARLKLSALDVFIESTNEHSHPPAQTQCEVAAVKSANQAKGGDF